MSGGVVTRCSAERERSGRPIVARLPDQSERRLRVLDKRIRALLDRTSCGASTLRIPEWPLAVFESVMEVDDYACILAGAEGDGLHFVLNMRGEARVLLFTNDIEVMASFAAGYLICRAEGDQELAEYL